MIPPGKILDLKRIYELPYPVVECVPNVSCGRSKATIKKIASAIRAVPDVQLLDISPDPDHNRTVYTFIGPPKAVAEAAFRLSRTAYKLLHIAKHQGVHPYIGIVDVVPLVPLKNISKRQVVLLARQFGQRLAKAFKVPVFLYGWAASRPIFKDLPAIRAGGLAALSRDIKTSRRPDFGPARIHPRYGATAVGARDFLIAFNVNLKGRDPRTALAAAKEIARKIREKDGGLPGIRAIGVLLKSKNLAQVSINITDIKKTLLKKVWQVVKKEAGLRNIRLAGTEIIGLTPDIQSESGK